MSDYEEDADGDEALEAPPPVSGMPIQQRRSAADRIHGRDDWVMTDGATQRARGQFPRDGGGYNPPPNIVDDASWSGIKPIGQDWLWQLNEDEQSRSTVPLHPDGSKGFGRPTPMPPPAARAAPAVAEALAPALASDAAPPPPEPEPATPPAPEPWRSPRLRIYFVHSERRLAVRNEEYGREDMGPPREPRGMTREAWLSSELAGATADLVGAERFFVAMGFSIVRSHDEGRNIEGFIALGIDPSECGNGYGGSLTAWFARPRTPAWERLRCKIESVMPDDLREAAVNATFMESIGYIGSVELNLDFAKEWDATGYRDGATEGHHHSSALEWCVQMPATYRLGENEPPEALLTKIPLLHFTHERLTEIHESVGEQAELTLHMLEAELLAMTPEDQPLVPMVLDGLLPAGEVVVMVGVSGIGKSTLAHQIVAAIASGAADALGYANPFAGRPGKAAVLSAEDALPRFMERGRQFAAVGLAGFILSVCDATGNGLAEKLRMLESVPDLRVLLVDPLKSWLKGDENSSDDMSEFMGLMLGFARRTGIVVILLHHTGKRGEGGPSSLRGVMDAARGSSVLKDRTRVMLALLRRADGTSRFGVVKTNMGAAVVEHEIALRFDLATGLHHRIDGPPGKARGSASRAAQPAPEGVAPAGPGPQNDAAAAMEAVATVTAAGGKVCRTGKRSLHALKLPALAGLSRVRVVAAVDAALAAGLLVAEGGQIKVAVPVPEGVTGTL